MKATKVYLVRASRARGRGKAAELIPDIRERFYITADNRKSAAAMAVKYLHRLYANINDVKTEIKRKNKFNYTFSIDGIQWKMCN